MNEGEAEQEMSRPIDRVARMREIENMGTDREKFENIEREFQDFLQEIVGDTLLEKFREQYELLKTSYRTEQELIKKCLDLNKRALDSAKEVNAAVRLAASEMEQIENLNIKSEKALDELSRMKLKEEESRQEIQILKNNITNLKRQQDQATELEEDRELRRLKNEYDELLRTTNDQSDNIVSLQFKNNELLDEK